MDSGRNFYGIGDHVICLQEISHFSAVEGAVVVVMRNGAEVLCEPGQGSSKWDVYKMLVDAIRSIGA